MTFLMEKVDSFFKASERTRRFYKIGSFSLQILPIDEHNPPRVNSTAPEAKKDSGGKKKDNLSLIKFNFSPFPVLKPKD